MPSSSAVVTQPDFPAVGRSEAPSYGLAELGWLVVAALGMAAIAAASAWLELSRDVFLIPYTAFGFALLVAYVRSVRMSVWARLSFAWPLGLALAVLASIFVVQSVIAQPASMISSGARLAFEIVWWGLVYGVLDGLLLSVLPVVIAERVFDDSRLLAALIALCTSACLAALYHLGFPEFRGFNVLYPLASVSVMTALTIAARNPLPAIVGHSAMHVAAVLHGPASVLQLPPH